MVSVKLSEGGGEAVKIAAEHADVIGLGQVHGERGGAGHGFQVLAEVLAARALSLAVFKAFEETLEKEIGAIDQAYVAVRERDSVSGQRVGGGLLEGMATRTHDYCLMHSSRVSQQPGTG